MARAFASLRVASVCVRAATAGVVARRVDSHAAASRRDPGKFTRRVDGVEAM